MGLPVIAYCFLAAFCVSAIIHLICCWRGSGSAYTKPLLISLLALFYASAAPKPSWVLIAALAASWLGDVLLMPKGNKWFVAGGISFLISHMIFIFVYIPYIRYEGLVWFIIILAAAAYIGISAYVMRLIWGGTPKMMRVPMFLYLAANSTMNLFALAMLFSLMSAGAVMAFIGAIMFFTSDCVLFISRFSEKRERIPKRGFIIMLTYIAGEALITAGVMAVENVIF